MNNSLFNSNLIKYTNKPSPPPLPSRKRKQDALAKKLNASRCTVNASPLAKCVLKNATAMDARMTINTPTVSKTPKKQSSRKQ